MQYVCISSIVSERLSERCKNYAFYQKSWVQKYNSKIGNQLHCYKVSSTIQRVTVAIPHIFFSIVNLEI